VLEAWAIRESAFLLFRSLVEGLLKGIRCVWGGEKTGYADVVCCSLTSLYGRMRFFTVCDAQMAVRAHGRNDVTTAA
jgi:hypothetical protein